MAVKVLSTKSAGEITPYKRAEEKQEEKPKGNAPTSRVPETKLKRSLSTSMVGWVQKYKAANNFIKIDPNKVELKKVEEREGPPSPDPGSDEESNKGSPAVPQRRFLVDKVSSSSRGSWIAKMHPKEDEEEEEDFDYVDDDPNRVCAIFCLP